MRSILFPILFAASLTIPALEAAAAPRIQSGLWEVSIAGTVAGVQTPAVTQQLCFGDKEIADIKQLLPNGGSCDLNNTKMSANSGSWNFQCKGELPVSGSIDLNFGSDRFSGTLNLTISGNGATVGGQGDSQDSSTGKTQINETLNCSN